MMLKLLFNQMTRFIDFKVGVEEYIGEDDDVSDDSDLDSLSSFIDNGDTGNDVNFYQSFNNAETDLEETLKVEYEKGLEDLENFGEISSLCESSEDEAEIDDFVTSAEKVKKIRESLLPKFNSDEKTVHNNFIRVILYALRYEKENKTDLCDKNEFKKVIDENLIEQLDEKNINLYLICKNLINAMKLICSYQIIITL